MANTNAASLSSFVQFLAGAGGVKSYLDGAVTSDVAGNGCRGPTVPAIPRKGFAPFGSLAPSQVVLLNFATFLWVVLIPQK